MPCACSQSANNLFDWAWVFAPDVANVSLDVIVVGVQLEQWCMQLGEALRLMVGFPAQ